MEKRCQEQLLALCNKYTLREQCSCKGRGPKLTIFFTKCKCFFGQRGSPPLTQRTTRVNCWSNSRSAGVFSRQSPAEEFDQRVSHEFHVKRRGRRRKPRTSCNELEATRVLITKKGQIYFRNRRQCVGGLDSRAPRIEVVVVATAEG